MGNSRCYKPWEGYSLRHTQTRTRTCQDFKYQPGPGMEEILHPDENQRCTSKNLTQTASGCPSSFSECPPLRKLVITVGDDSYDGTLNWIEIRFRNNDEEYCETDYLNYNSYGFSFVHGDTVIINTNVDELSNKAADALGGCQSGNFRPDRGLWVQVEATRHMLSSWWDGYRFSKIQATFGSDDDPLKTVWTSGDTEFCDGCGYNGYSSWFKMWQV